MKSIFMRVLFCKIHCPSFICFCKPSAAAAHLYNQGPLKLENSQLVPPPVVSVITDDDNSNTSDQLPSSAVEVKVKGESLEQEEDGKEIEIVLRSCIKKKTHFNSGSPKAVERKKVQWMDNLGKELVDIKEFESSESGDTDNELDNRGCVCVIL